MPNWFKRGIGPLFRYCYFALIVGAAFFLVHSQAPEATDRFKATKPLAVNHVLAKGDLEAAERGAELDEKALGKLTGQFAQRVIRAGQQISADDFAQSPLLLPPPNLVLTGVPLQADLKTENAGSVFRVCEGHKSVDALRADAVLCPSGTRTSCSVIFYLPAKEAGELLQKVAPGSTTRLIPTACPDPPVSRPAILQGR